ncbi:MAG: hypothetical protein CVV13_13625 [Gammaproteobacteria bacterium HGW-Gammaproteobacteria-3]|nr:MAG: hypothetical protein CVV13_13625 [Gammaproteobacteria bacterium HGW-Gammaproteobacteria-3]
MELKAVQCLEPVHEAHLPNYLKAATIEVELLMSFSNEPAFKFLVYNKKQKANCLILVDQRLNNYVF